MVSGKNPEYRETSKKSRMSDVISDCLKILREISNSRTKIKKCQKSTMMLRKIPKFIKKRGKIWQISNCQEKILTAEKYCEKFQIVQKQK